jgi:hypothetical protein
MVPYWIDLHCSMSMLAWYQAHAPDAEVSVRVARVGCLCQLLFERIHLLRRLVTGLDTTMTRLSATLSMETSGFVLIL